MKRKDPLVKDLRTQLKEMGLPTSGKKAELLFRLQICKATKGTAAPPLEELNRLARERPTHEWTPDEVRVIAGPFFESARWKNDDEVRPRVELLYRLPRQKTKGDQELCDFLIRAEKWKMQRERHRCLLRYESVSADPIYEAIKPLLKKDWTKWTDEEVAPAVEALAGLTCIFAAKSSPHALREYLEWSRGPWHEYLAFHPDVLRRVDPCYVVANVGGGPMPPKFVAAVAAYPPAGGAHVPPPACFNGSTYVWPFGDLKDAEHFMGWMQASCPGLHFCYVESNNPMLYI